MKLHELLLHTRTEEKCVLSFGWKNTQKKGSVTGIDLYFKYLNTIRMVEILGVGILLAIPVPKRRVSISVRLTLILLMWRIG